MSAPWIVLQAMVNRADSSPDEAGRATRPGYLANRAGQGIHDPGVSDQTPAFCERPQLEWEAFDEYWRKTHGPKIIHNEGDGDDATALLVFYLQQHRLPGGPTSAQAPPYPAKLGDDGMLVPDPAARAVPYGRPRFDGIAQLAFASKAALLRFFDAEGKYGTKIVPDEAVFIKGFAFNLCEEHVILESEATRRDPIVLIKNHVRHPALSRATFRESWRGSHADLVRGLAETKQAIRRYAQLHNVSDPDDAFYDEAGDRFDGTTLMSFANMNDLEDFLGSASYREIEADESDFCAESDFYTAINYVVRDDAVRA